MDADLIFTIVSTLAKIILFTHIGLVLAAYMPWVERKVSAWMQDRVGPNRVGWAGLLQPIADSLKFFFKEDIILGHTEKALFALAPALTVIPALLVISVIPFAPALEVFG
ncbi:MAG: NADH-quinone oxidoreductase subunit H, partial [Planctomycetota bacterium]